MLFGCGGDRDRSKRSLMAKAASGAADVVIVTSDNPRIEDPLKIIEDIKPGLAAGKLTVIEPIAAKPIANAIRLCRPDDLLVVAGRVMRIIRFWQDEIHFDDREIV